MIMIYPATKLPAWLTASATVLLAATVANAQPATNTPTTAQPVYASPAAADPVEALGRYLRVLSTMPRNLDALTGAGKAALAIGDANAAISFFARAEEISPRDGRIKFGLASALVQVEQPKTALKLFGDAVSLGVPEGEIAGERGLAYDLRGDSRRAQADYVQSLRWRLDDEITRRLAVSQAISGDRQAALATIDALLRRQDRAAWRIRAFVLALTGDQKGAQEVAVAVMPRGQADALTPYFSRLAALGPAQKAAAVHLGQFPSDGRTSNASPPVYADAVPNSVPAPVGGPRSDVPLIPSGAALGSSQSSAEVANARAPRRRPGTTEMAGFSSAVTGTSAASSSTRPTYLADSSQVRSRSGTPPVAAITPTPTAPAISPPVAPSVAAAPIVRQPQPTVPGTAPNYASRPVAAVAPAPQVTPSASSSTASTQQVAPTVASVPPAAMPAPAPATAPAPQPAPSAVATATAPVASAATVPVASTAITQAAVPLPPVAAPVTNSAAQAGPGFSADPLTPAAAPLVAERPAAVFGPPVPAELAMASRSPAVTGFAASAATVRPIDLPESAAAEPAAPPRTASPAPTAAAAPQVQRSAPTPVAPRQSRLIAPAAKAPAKAEAEEKSTATKVAIKGKETSRAKAAADEKPTKLAMAETRDGKSRAAGTKADKSDAKDKDKAETASAGKSAKSKDAAAKDAKGKDASAKDTSAKDAKGKVAAKDTGSKDAKGKDGKSKDAATREADAKDKADKATKAPAGERYWVQVASGANRADLGKAWERTKAKAPKLLGGRTTYTAPWKQSNRLLVGPFKSEDEAQGFVNSLSKAGTGGIQFTSRGGMKVEPLASE